MKSLLSSRNLFVVAFLALLATNVFVLTGIAYNRSAEPDALVTLTERELSLPYRLHKENTGLFLNLQWRTLNQPNDYDNYNYAVRETPTWFDIKKLEALGYSPVKLEAYRARSTNYPRIPRPLAKEVFIVLENDGRLHAEAIKRAEKVFQKQKALLAIDNSDNQVRKNLEHAEERLKQERIAASRLFAIDAGLDSQKLRQQYQDRKHFIIAKGVIEPRYSHHKDQKLRIVSGYIKKLNIERIHIPLEQRKSFNGFLTRNSYHRANIEAPRYQIELAYGQRLEPWVKSIELLDSQ